MYVCACGREYNSAKLQKCPGCGRSRSGAPLTTAPASPAGSTGQPSGSLRAAPAAAGPQARALADKVETLGSVIVGVAWIIAIGGVVAGLLTWVTTSQAGLGSSGFVSGLIIAVAALSQAALLGLVGSYAQMRACQVLNK